MTPRNWSVTPPRGGCSGGATLAELQTLTVRPVEEAHMDAIIYLVGLVVVVMAVLSFFGLR
jgi:hypothetical protein